MTRRLDDAAHKTDGPTVVLLEVKKLSNVTISDRFRAALQLLTTMGSRVPSPVTPHSPHRHPLP